MKQAQQINHEAASNGAAEDFASHLTLVEHDEAKRVSEHLATEEGWDVFVRAVRNAHEMLFAEIEAGTVNVGDPPRHFIRANDDTTIGMVLFYHAAEPLPSGEQITTIGNGMTTVPMGVLTVPPGLAEAMIAAAVRFAPTTTNWTGRETRQIH